MLLSTVQKPTKKNEKDLTLYSNPNQTTQQTGCPKKTCLPERQVFQNLGNGPLCYPAAPVSIHYPKCIHEAPWQSCQKSLLTDSCRLFRSPLHLPLNQLAILLSFSPISIPAECSNLLSSVMFKEGPTIYSIRYYNSH